jgi:hypothetical protein
LSCLPVRGVTRDYHSVTALFALGMLLAVVLVTLATTCGRIAIMLASISVSVPPYSALARIIATFRSR